MGLSSALLRSFNWSFSKKNIILSRLFRSSISSFVLSSYCIFFFFSLFFLFLFIVIVCLHILLNWIEELYCCIYQTFFFLVKIVFAQELPFYSILSTLITRSRFLSTFSFVSLVYTRLVTFRIPFCDFYITFGYVIILFSLVKGVPGGATLSSDIQYCFYFHKSAGSNITASVRGEKGGGIGKSNCAFLNIYLPPLV